MTITQKQQMQQLKTEADRFDRELALKGGFLYYDRTESTEAGLQDGRIAVPPTK